MISSRMTSGRSLMRSTGDSTGSSDLGGRGARRFSPRYRVRDLQPASPLAGASSSWRWGQPTPFSLWASRRAHGFEQSSQRRAYSGEEGGLGISVGVEEEEQVFSVRVRKKVSGVFWTSEEDWGAVAIGGRRKRESELFVFKRPAALTTRFFPRTALFFCVAALELAHGLG